MTDVEKAILRDVLLHSPALFYTSLTAPTGRPIDPFKHQFQSLYHAMVSHPVRMLIADEIGLGKTVQALAIARYLELQRGARKILVLVPKILREQWKMEIKRVGGVPWVIHSGGEVRNVLNAVRNAGRGYVVVSIDLAKRPPHREEFLGVNWDLVIIDEAHNVTLGTQRFDFVRELIGKGWNRLNVLLLSATPHRGNPKDYLARISLLDPTLTPLYPRLDDPHFYGKTHGTLVLRRTKKTVNELEGREVFKKCDFNAVVVEITEAERLFFRELQNVLFEMIKNSRENSPEALLAVLLRKRAASSYGAALKTISKIAESANTERKGRAEKVSKYIQSLFGLGYDEMELEEFNEIDDAVEKIIEEYSPFLDEGQKAALRKILRLGERIGERDSKLEMVAGVVAYHLKKGEKVIVFTEFKDTLDYLTKRLPKVLAEKHRIHLSREDISFLHGGMSSNDIEEGMARFEKRGKLLISTDVASEGLNLQVASVLINYEAPWSPIKLEQRVGRIWRLSQPRETTAYTFFLAAETDLYVLENLYQKIMNIADALGSGPKLGRPIFGQRMLSGDFEHLWKEEPVEGTFEREKPSEYELVLASIKRELSGYAGAIINTLKSLRQNIEKVVPPDTADQVRKGLESILSPRDFDSNFIYEVLEGYLEIVLKKPSVPEIRPLLYRILENGKDVETPLRIGVNKKVGEYRLYSIRLVDSESGEELHRYPVLVKTGKSGIKKVFYGTELLMEITKILSNEHLILGPLRRDDPNGIHIEGKLMTLARDRFYNIKSKYRDYDTQLRRKLRKRPLFKETKILVKELVRIEGITEGRFAILKHVPQGLIELYGLGENDIEIPTKEYENIVERNFVPLKDILESEQRAMGIVMELERRRLEQEYGLNGDWKVEDVSLREHYDIKVTEPENERYIEVKGHKPLILTAEITSAEYEFARAHRDRYWLYIVANLGKNRPVILKVFRPFEDKRKIYAVLEDGREVDVTTEVTVHTREKTRRVISLK
ncbi:hypothetical protein A3L02_08595 [Thermococcus celer Vu 13 = JCM 8558]|uniref:Helicase n=1 Tax=Thermococcus celer Vu 13 = JCM 8558 TaxID=1293037 RepID=A0A218P3Y4_THECE|nr:hypothetical protein A3L02_08595 [Thermococcus celer Vu 13 = JCM 8558]